MIDHYRAYIKARSIVENLLLAHASEPTEYSMTFHEQKAKDDLRRLADELGFDLVPRVKQEEAA